MPNSSTKLYLCIFVYVCIFPFVIIFVTSNWKSNIKTDCTFSEWNFYNLLCVNHKKIRFFIQILLPLYFIVIFLSLSFFFFFCKMSIICVCVFFNLSVLNNCLFGCHLYSVRKILYNNNDFMRKNKKINYNYKYNDSYLHLKLFFKYYDCFF